MCTAYITLEKRNVVRHYCVSIHYGLTINMRSRENQSPKKSRPASILHTLPGSTDATTIHLAFETIRRLQQY